MTSRDERSFIESSIPELRTSSQNLNNHFKYRPSILNCYTVSPSSLIDK